MRPDAPALLWQAHHATLLVQQFVAGRSWPEYERDALLRSAVERQFQIVGEALNRLLRVDPEVAAQVPDLRRIVAFRNVLVHAYAAIDDALVWEVAVQRVPALERVLGELLQHLDV